MYVFTKDVLFYVSTAVSVEYKANGLGIVRREGRSIHNIHQKLGYILIALYQKNDR
jgi:hypothetical protein